MAIYSATGNAADKAALLIALNTFVVTTCGWTLRDDLSASSPAAYVWSTVGSLTTETCYIRAGISSGTGIVLNTYRAWDATGHVGYSASPTYNAANFSIFCAASGSTTYYFYGDVDCIHVVTMAADAYYFTSFGILTSNYSRTYATASESITAGTRTIAVSATTPFTVGRVYGVHDPASNSATVGAYEPITITAIDPGVSITAVFANSHPSGARIGEDVNPYYVTRSTNTAGICSSSGVLTNANTLHLGNASPISYQDYDYRTQRTWLWPAMLSNAIATYDEIRGTLKNLYVTGPGIITTLDTADVDAENYVFFNTSSYSTVAIRTTDDV